jgi:type II secretory pathway pseudopilin PulG
MPYIITVLALIVVGVGFTLFNSNTEVTKNELTEQSIEATEESIENMFGASSTNTEAVDTLPEMLPEVMPEKTTTPTKPQTGSAAPAPTPSPTPAPTPAPAPAPVNANDYTNGSYSTQTSFRTPDGTYQMDVTLTVSNDKVTAATVGYDSQGARDGYSKRFSSAYKSAIIGQDLGSASLSRVGGASLTTRAFNNALSSIRTQAS